MAEAKWPNSCRDMAVRHALEAAKVHKGVAESVMAALGRCLDEVAATTPEEPVIGYRRIGAKDGRWVYFVSCGAYFLLFTYRDDKRWIIAQAVVHNRRLPAPSDIPATANEYD